MPGWANGSHNGSTTDGQAFVRLGRSNRPLSAKWIVNWAVLKFVSKAKRPLVGMGVGTSAIRNENTGSVPKRLKGADLKSARSR